MSLTDLINQLMNLIILHNVTLQGVLCSFSFFVVVVVQKGFESPYRAYYELVLYNVILPGCPLFILRYFLLLWYKRACVDCLCMHNDSRTDLCMTYVHTAMSQERHNNLPLP